MQAQRLCLARKYSSSAKFSPQPNTRNQSFDLYQLRRIRYEVKMREVKLCINLYYIKLSIINPPKAALCGVTRVAHP